MRYRLLIFDFDGTLADTFPAFVRHMRQVVERFKLRALEDREIDALRGMGAREIMDYLGLPLWKVPLVARYMRKLMAADPAQTRLFPGVQELLPHLAASGFTLAIVSSNSEANIRAILGAENCRQIETFACGAALFGKARRFRQVLKHTGFAARETLAIGDELRDLDAARETHIDFGAVAWGYTRIEAFPPSSVAFVFREIAELSAV